MVRTHHRIDFLRLRPIRRVLDDVPRERWSGGQIRLAFDAEELAALRDIRTDRVGEREAGVLMGLPAYAVGDLVDAGILDVERHPWILEHYGRPLLTRRAVETLVERIRLGSSRSATDPIGLAGMLRAFGGAPKPWAAIVGMLLSGRLAYRWFEQGGVSSIGVTAMCAASILGLPAPIIRDDYSQEDAAEILNVKYGNVAHPQWARFRLTSDRKSRVHGRRLAVCAAARITVGELSARSGVEPVTLVSMLKARGCERIDEMGYDRSAVLPLVGGMFAGGTPRDRACSLAGAPVSLGAATPS